MKHKPLALTEEEILKLEEIVRKGKDWRSRDRAKTILRLASGDSSKEAAEAQGICTQTVYERRQQWLSKGFAGLLDAPAQVHRGSCRPTCRLLRSGRRQAL